MDELEKGRKLEISGGQRGHFVEEFARLIRAWGIPMPPSEPLVLDFGLGDFRTFGLIECWIANESRAGYCGKYLFVFDGQSCPRHRHGEKHETFFLVKGAVLMRCGGREFEMAEGSTLAVPPGEFHGFKGTGPALLLELSTPCLLEDNEFSDTRIPFGKKPNR